ncbi:hypothetical protein BGZ98_001700 [Dissophora globulifera]|nr:hypothetical protein BGZ98_001700 [Dissophora globulifera]
MVSTSSRSSYLRGFLFSTKKSNPDLASSASTSSPSSLSDSHPHQLQSSPGKSPTKKFSLQKFYYPRNTMNAATLPSSASSGASPLAKQGAGSPTSTFKSTPGSFSRIDSNNGPLAPLAFESPRTLGLIQPATSIPTPFIPPTPPIAQVAVPSLAMVPDALPASTPTTSSFPEPSFNTLLSPETPAPLMSPTPSLVLPTKPMSIPTRSTPVLSLPLSPISPPGLSISPSSPPSSLSLHPMSLPTLSTSYSSSSSASSLSATSSPNTSPSNSPTEASSGPLVSSPLQSDQTPYPANAISPSKLAAMIERGEPNKQGVSAGARPLVLDLRLHPDFEPISIVHSININLPTLLMRRYRRGGAVSAFALESFITMPSDKDFYHLIQDGWRRDHDQSGSDVAHDVVVLDQDMKAGKEEYGRSPSPAWTLLSVLERGGGNCGGPIRLWYLEGGFEAFQEWDMGEKFLMRPGSTFELSVTPEVSATGQQQDVEMALADDQEGSVHPLTMSLSLPSSSTSSTFTDAKTAQAIDHAVSLTNASLGSTPRRGPPARRESLFSLNTKSLQRPPGLSRSQTIGVSALNIKPLSIPPLNAAGLHPLDEGQPNAATSHSGSSGLSQPLPPLRHKGSWLTVPTSVSVPALSPTMPHSGHPMDVDQSGSSDHMSTWSANSGRSPHGESGANYGSNNQAQMLGSRKSFSSTTTLFSLNHQNGATHGIQEEEEDETAGSGVHPFQSSGSSIRRHHSGNSFIHTSPPAPGASYFEANTTSRNNSSGYKEYQSHMFADGIDSQTNSFHSNNAMMSHSGYDYDDMGEEGGDDGEQEISCILPNFLYLGPEIATEEQVQELERLGVKRVLNMARECEDLLVANRPDIEYHKISMQDHVEADVSTGLLQAVDVIAASDDSPIYVHCKAGKSRSVTAIIAYLMTQLHWSLNKAYSHVLTQRPCMCPNIGFVTELMRMEERMMGTERAGGLARAGSLNSILSLSTAGSGPQHHSHHYHHHSLQHPNSLTKGGSPKMLSAKSSMNSMAILSPFQ